MPLTPACSAFFAGAEDGGGGLSGAAEGGGDGDDAARAPSIAPLSASSDVELAEAVAATF